MDRGCTHASVRRRERMIVGLAFAKEMVRALRVDGSDSKGSLVQVVGEGELPSFFDVTGLATASIGAAGLAVARLSCPADESPPPVRVDRRLASHWFGWSLRPQGWERPSAWDDLAGDYEAGDGWIRLHTNVPAHRAAALSVLAGGAGGDRKLIEDAVSKWSAEDLESAIVGAGGCAATMRSLEQWQSHPQGLAVARTPLVVWNSRGSCAPDSTVVDPSRPLAKIHILDLTRILAGPVGGRFLAAYGADVLRIDPPDWDEPGVIPEVTLGKRCAELNLKDPADREIFEKLIASADVLLHGYRADALAGLGYDGEALRALNPALIDVSLNAYGWAGDWQNRRGFDSLVQMSCGIADHGMKASVGGRPRPLPVQALDHATGYLLAAAVVSALLQRRQGEVMSAKLSLARVARLLCTTKSASHGPEFAPATEDELDPQIEDSDWGPAKRVRWPLQIDGVDSGWSHPATRLRSAQPVWAE
jgi:hypothetical protein